MTIAYNEYQSISEKFASQAIAQLKTLSLTFLTPDPGSRLAVDPLYHAKALEEFYCSVMAELLLELTEVSPPEETPQSPWGSIVHKPLTDPRAQKPEKAAPPSPRSPRTTTR